MNTATCSPGFQLRRTKFRTSIHEAASGSGCQLSKEPRRGFGLVLIEDAAVLTTDCLLYAFPFGHDLFPCSHYASHPGGHPVRCKPTHFDATRDRQPDTELDDLRIRLVLGGLQDRLKQLRGGAAQRQDRLD